jgi:CRP-like cAMP-binding protein
MSLILNILKSVPFFQSLTDEEHSSIMGHIAMQYYPADYMLFKQGDEGDAMYILKHGKVRIFNMSGPLAELSDGQFFGEMALMDGQLRNASAQTASESEVFVLKRQDFDQLLKDNPAIAEKIRTAYFERKK